MKVKGDIYEGHRTTEATFDATISICAQWLTEKPFSCILPCGVEAQGQFIYQADRTYNRQLSNDDIALIKQRTLSALPSMCQ